MNTSNRFFSVALVASISALAACVHGGDRHDGNDASASPPDASSEDGSRTTAVPDAPAVVGDDVDGDGVPAPADCDDTNPLVYPGAVEDCTTEIDEDCDGYGGVTEPDPDCDEDIDEDSDEDVDEDSDEDVDEDSDEDSDEHSDEHFDAGLPDAR